MAPSMTDGHLVPVSPASFRTPIADGHTSKGSNLHKLRRVKPIDSWVLPVTINGVQTFALLDTGAACCLLSKAVFEAMPRSLHHLANYPRDMKAVGNHTLSTLGDLVCDVVIQSKNYTIDMVVSSENESIGCILGMDFLQDYDCDIALRTGHLIIGDAKIKLRRESATNTIARIKLEDDVTLPPRTELAVSGRPEAMNKRLTSLYSCVEPSPTMHRKSKQQILTGCAVVQTNARHITVPLMNTSDETHVLRKGTVIGIMRATSKVCTQETPYDPLGLGRDRVSKLPNSSNSPNCQQTKPPCTLDHVAPLMNDLATDITQAQRTELQETLLEYQDVFSSGPEDVGLTDMVEHTIDTGDSRPIRLPPRRLPISKQQCEADEISKMLQKGVIEPSSSPWASPVVLVTKKDGSTRFCVDYRKLNDVTRKDAYPLPRIDDTLDALKGSMYFSTLDLYSGYWQVKMDDADKHKTAFITRQGLFQFCTMPFGLCNTPATFERLMELTLSGLTWKCCLVYLDDIIVYGRNFDEALVNLRLVLDRIRRARLKLKTSKCELFRAHVPFLGHIVTRDGIYVNPAKCKAVAEWPIPRRVKDVRSFVGLASYYRRFIPNFATVAAPLTEMYRDPKNTIIQWTAARQKAFDTLKQALTSAPVLAYPSREDKFYLSTDASDDGIGAVLEQDQKQPDGTTKRVVIAYASKSLSRSQRKYCATNRELLAVIWAVENFRYYLLGRHFNVITDHASLVWLRNFKNPEGMVARWLQRLSPYDFTISHRAGKIHENADGLSRQRCRPCKRPGCSDCKIIKLNGKPIPELPENIIDIAEDDDDSFGIRRLFSTPTDITATAVKKYNVPLDRRAAKENTAPREEKLIAAIELTQPIDFATPNQIEHADCTTIHKNDFKEATDLYIARGPTVLSKGVTVLSKGVSDLNEGISTNSPIVSSLTRTADKNEHKTYLRAARKNKRNKEKLPKKQQMPKKKLNSVATAIPNTGNSTDEDNSQVDPLMTYCSNELLQAQGLDKDICIVKKLLQEYKHKKPKVKDITQYGPKVKSLWSKWGYLRIRDGVLYREWSDNLGHTHMRYVVPESLRRSFFTALHDTPLAGHQGINRTLIHLKNRYYWPDMLSDVKLWCAQCHTCMKAKRLPINRRSPLQQQLTGSPFERVAVDLMGPFEETANGNKYIAVFGDYFTKWTIAEPLKDKTAIGVADLFYTKWVALFGCPSILHSDRGGEFKAELIQRLCDVLRVYKTFTSPYRPESDGQIERQNRTLQSMLRTFVNEARNDWDDHLPAVTCAYRATPHDSTGVSPFRMVFGHDIVLPIDLQNDVGLRQQFPTCPVAYVEWLRQTLYIGHDVARAKLKTAAARQKKKLPRKMP